MRLEPTVRVQRERAEAGRAFFEADIVCKKKVCNAVTRERARGSGEFFSTKQNRLYAGFCLKIQINFYTVTSIVLSNFFSALFAAFSTGVFTGSSVKPLRRALRHDVFFGSIPNSFAISLI